MATVKQQLALWEKNNKEKIELLRREVRRQAFIKKVGQEIVRLIKGRTRTGYGLQGEPSSNGIFKRGKLKPLVEKTIEVRTAYAKGNKVSEFFSPKRSNLSLTGQLLDAVDYEVSEGEVRIFVASTSRYDTSEDNATIAEYVSEARPFMGLTDQEFRVIRSDFEREIRRLINKIFGRT